LRERGRIDPRAGDDDHARRGNPLLRLRECLDHAPQQVPADARAADGDDADLHVVAVTELVTQRGAIGEVGGIEAGDVAREGEVLARPVAHPRQLWPERVGDDVIVVADIDRAVAEPREARDVLDHLRVVVRGDESLALLAVGHR
jgi:hypothetical protein